MLVSYNYYACKKVDLERIPLVKVVSVDGITAVSAYVSGEITDVGEGNVGEFGFVYGTGDFPTMANEKISSFEPFIPGSFALTVNDLAPNTVYKIRGFVAVEGEYIYSENVFSFSTLQNAVLPTVVTAMVVNVGSTTAESGGDVTDNGGATITARGVCWSQQVNPTIDGPKTADGSGLGSFVSNISGLTPNTTYYLRAYATNISGTAYGSEKTFTTQSGGVPLYEWLQYDNGTNYDGIGLNSGGSFDVAIRFRPEQLVEYAGWKIIKFRFFPKYGFPISYSLEVFSGPEGNNLDYLQSIPSVTVDGWNEVILDTPHVIDNSTDLWVGYWIQNQPAGIFPAGVDEGPAIPYKSDLISMDGGISWLSLSTENPALNYNWNIQFYITNEAGLVKSVSANEVKIVKHGNSLPANKGDFVSGKMLNR